MPNDRPKEATARRLFAESGNRCAFPKCPNPIILDNSIVGDICHIKAESPKGPRFDPLQTIEERHHYSNLVLLCKLHHKVVDDDDVSYSVERLLEMKHQHIDLVGSEHSQSVNEVMTQQFVVSSQSSTGQTGGVSAHTINTQNFQVFSQNERRANQPEAVAAFWEAILFIEKETSDLTYLHAILTTEEISELVEGKINHATFSGVVSKYSNIDAFEAVVMSENVKTARLKEPFVQKELVIMFNSIVALFGRIAVLISVSNSKRQYQDWRTDALMQHNFREVCTEAQFLAAARQNAGGINSLYAILKNKFLEHARS